MPISLKNVYVLFFVRDKSSWYFESDLYNHVYSIAIFYLRRQLFQNINKDRFGFHLDVWNNTRIKRRWDGDDDDDEDDDEDDDDDDDEDKDEEDNSSLRRQPPPNPA